MNIRSSFQKDTQTGKTKPGSYEWWYFDAHSVDGYSIVLIFYDGNPFSRRYIQSLENGERALAEQYPAISISVYKNSKPVYYAFEEFKHGRASFSSQHPAGNVGGSFFEGERIDGSIQYKLRLNHTLLNGDSIQGELLFVSVTGDLNDFGTVEHGHDTSQQHDWNLVLPKCHVSGELILDGTHQEKIIFNGIGYHDHNRGAEPMKESFKQWYWGRYHTESCTVVYYLMEENGVWDQKAWLFEDEGDFRAANREILKGDSEYSLFGLKCNRSIQFQTEEEEIFIQKGVVLDSGPFYIRFLGKLIMKKGNEIEVAEGISEYIYPSRIHNRLFWPLVNMRLRYPDREHWVQKSPVLYRWTW